MSLATTSSAIERRRYAGIDLIERGGAGVPVVILHGIGGRAESFRPLLSIWPAGARVFAWDMPGYGASDAIAMVPARLDHYAAALAAMLNDAGVSACHLVGQSLGALIAARFGVRETARVRSLTLMSPAYGYSSPNGLTDALAARVRDFNGEGAECFAAKRAPRLVARSDEKADVVAAVATQMATLTTAGHTQAVGILSEGNIAQDIAAVRVPLLFVSGDSDLVTPLAGTRALAAAASAPCHVIADAGHALYLEQPRAVADAIYAFQEAA